MSLRLKISALALHLALLAPAAFAEVFPSYPDVLVCSVSDPTNVQQWDTLVFYASARLTSGAILYKSLTSNPVLITIDTDKRISAPNLKDCDGLSVATLRKGGRAFDF